MYIQTVQVAMTILNSGRFGMAAFASGGIRKIIGGFSFSEEAIFTLLHINFKLSNEMVPRGVKLITMSRQL